MKCRRVKIEVGEGSGKVVHTAIEVGEGEVGDEGWQRRGEGLACEEEVSDRSRNRGQGDCKNMFWIGSCDHSINGNPVRRIRRKK